MLTLICNVTREQAHDLIQALYDQAPLNVGLINVIEESVNAAIINKQRQEAIAKQLETEASIIRYLDQQLANGDMVGVGRVFSEFSDVPAGQLVGVVSDWFSSVRP